MEKVTIVSCLQKGLTKKNNPYYQVTLQDGRVATCFNQEMAQKMNVEQEVDIQSKEWEGVTQYVINPPNQNKGFGGGKGFNLDFSQRRAALECACVGSTGNGDGAQVLVRADKFLEWLKK